MIWAGFVWLVNNAVYALALIGLASVVLRVLDNIVERQMLKRPQSRFWQRVDLALDCGVGFLGFLLDCLKVLSVPQKTPREKPGP